LTFGSATIIAQFADEAATMILPIPAEKYRIADAY
jgi:hypothetical protein